MEATNIVPRAIFRNTNDVNKYLNDMNNYDFFRITHGPESQRIIDRITVALKRALEDVLTYDPNCFPIIIKHLLSHYIISVNFKNTLFEGDFTGIDLEHTMLHGANILNSNFSNANLHNVGFYTSRDCSSKDCSSKISNTKFYNANLSDIEFGNIEISENTDFTSANLKNAIFNNAIIDETVIFNGTNLDNAEFEMQDYDNLSNNSFLGATYDGVEPEQVRQIIEENSVGDPTLKGGKQSKKKNS